MRNFRNILFVSQGICDETESLKQALSIAHNSGAALRALILCPEFPSSIAEYKQKYEEVLLQQLQDSIGKVQNMLGLSATDVAITFEFENSKSPVIDIIKRVLRDEHDLVIKQAEEREDHKGFRAFDMGLLRKSPCPVWLARPISRHRGEMRVAVAIDPENEEPAGEELSLRLLQVSRALADTCSDGLDIISCWEFEFEEYLRHSLWSNMTDEKMEDILLQTKDAHRAALESVIRKSGIGGKVRVHHVRGKPDHALPAFVESEKVDVLVMGTVARIGLASFTIGNTAENILQNIGCSLLALKPPGFVSSVKAY